MQITQQSSFYAEVKLGDYAKLRFNKNKQSGIRNEEFARRLKYYAEARFENGKPTNHTNKVQPKQKCKAIAQRCTLYTKVKPGHLDLGPGEIE